MIDGLGERIPHFRSSKFVPFLQHGERMADGTLFLIPSGEVANASLPKLRKQTQIRVHVSSQMGELQFPSPLMVAFISVAIASPLLAHCPHLYR